MLFSNEHFKVLAVIFFLLTRLVTVIENAITNKILLLLREAHGQGTEGNLTKETEHGKWHYCMNVN